ncbi:hypothetical protein PQX77_019642 [Marasmius sp. AFHP31]|nr:hypothetical protein PQX77_019642 [Marasmius sp. AFHP31]
MASRKKAASQQAAQAGKASTRRGQTDEEPVDDPPPVKAATKPRATKSKPHGKAPESTSQEPATQPAGGRSCIVPKPKKGSKQPPHKPIDKVPQPCPQPKPRGKASQTKAIAKTVVVGKDKGKGVDRIEPQMEVVNITPSNDDDPFAGDSDLEREWNTPFKIQTNPLAHKPNTPGPEFLTFDEGDYKFVEDNAPGQLVIASTPMCSTDGHITAAPLQEEEEETGSKIEVQRQSNPETYTTPKRPKTKAQLTKRARSEAKAKKDAAEDYSGEVAEVEKGSGNLDSPGPSSLPQKSRKVGSRMFREDRPYILCVFVGDLVPFLSLEPSGKCSACNFCKEKAKGDPRYSVSTFREGSSTGTIRSQFWDQHRHSWVTACNTANPPIKIQGKQAFSLEVLRKLLMKLNVEEDLPISFIEAPTLRNILLIARESLRDNQVLKRTAMMKLIMESFATEMHTLKHEFQSAMGKISFMTDGWATFLLYPFIAVIAHWIQKEDIKDTKLQEQLGIDYTLVLRSDVIGKPTASSSCHQRIKEDIG